MSLLDERPTNPAKLFIQVKNGALSYYDKESAENVEVPTPLKFVVLDQLSTIKGWSDQDESGFWSNEVKSVGKDTLNVRTKNGLKESGIWRDIKGSVALAGAKCNASIYMAVPAKSGMQIVNLSLKGAALKAWIEFLKHNDVRKNAVILSGWADDKKGAVSFKTPIFETAPMEDGERDKAVELAQELKTYLDEYFSYNPDAHNEAQAVQKDTVIDDISDEPVDLSDIPF